jgi:hypothetical protein
VEGLGPVWAKLVHPAPEKEIQYVRLALITCTAHAAPRTHTQRHATRRRSRPTTRSRECVQRLRPSREGDCTMVCTMYLIVATLSDDVLVAGAGAEGGA